MEAFLEQEAYKPLFPYFGGKSKAAHLVWQRFGKVDHYIEPFFGSGAVLFLQPGISKFETVNDIDGLLVNAWRAVRAAPKETAKYADWIISEADLHARHLWLLGKKESLTERLIVDPEFYDTKAAGWWIWGASCWLGSGWCSGNGAWVIENGKLVKSGNGNGVRLKRPSIAKGGGGIAKQLPSIGKGGGGIAVTRRFRKGETRLEYIQRLFEKFSQRLQNVRILCGDWSRTVKPSLWHGHKTIGIFLDPPYSSLTQRCDDIYAHEDLEIAHEVRKWAITHGNDPRLRIALCGYEGEHQMPDDWECVAWERPKGLQVKEERKAARFSERIWFSPYCLKPKMTPLFD